MASNKDASLETTRQMLDELDALMEKMLALPVTEDGGASQSKAAAHAPALTAKLTMLPPVSEAPKPAATGHPVLNPPHLEVPATVSAPQPAPLTNDVLPPSLMPQLEPMLAAVPDPVVPAVDSDGTSMFLFVNQVFDVITMPLGGLGRWLRGSEGRLALGLLGMAALAGAIVWALHDLLGWNWLPPSIR